MKIHNLARFFLVKSKQMTQVVDTRISQEMAWYRRCLSFSKKDIPIWHGVRPPVSRNYICCKLFLLWGRGSAYQSQLGVYGYYNENDKVLCVDYQIVH